MSIRYPTRLSGEGFQPPAWPFRAGRRAFFLLAAASPSPAVGQDGQRFADLGTCTTARGEVIRECRIGYRTFGRLNARRDNAVLVPTWHGGRSETMTFLLDPDGWVDTHPLVRYPGGQAWQRGLELPLEQPVAGRAALPQAHARRHGRRPSVSSPG